MVEEGSHAELMSLGGYYRRLFEAQFVAEEERELFGSDDDEDEEAV